MERPEWLSLYSKQLNRIIKCDCFNDVNFLTNKPPIQRYRLYKKLKKFLENFSVDVDLSILKLSFGKILEYFIETIGNFVDEMHLKSRKNKTKYRDNLINCLDDYNIDGNPEKKEFLRQLIKNTIECIDQYINAEKLYLKVGKEIVTPKQKRIATKFKNDFDMYKEKIKMITPPTPTSLLTFVAPPKNVKLQGGYSIFKNPTPTSSPSTFASPSAELKGGYSIFKSPKFGFKRSKKSKKPKRSKKPKKRSITRRRACSPLCKRV